MWEMNRKLVFGSGNTSLVTDTGVCVCLCFFVLFFYLCALYAGGSSSGSRRQI